MKRPLLLAGALALLSIVPAFAAPKKLLVVSVTMAFRHSSIETGENVIAELARQSGDFTVDFVRQPAGAPKLVFPPRRQPGQDEAEFQAAQKKFEADDAAYKAGLATWLPRAREALQALSPENLKRYDAVLFCSTTGDLPLPDKEAFVRWVAEGHAFIGIHAATDTFHGFPEFVKMIGGEFLTHGPQVEVDCLKDDPAHLATKHLPEPWTLFDEIYQFKNYERSAVHQLLSLDKHPNEKTPGFYPVSWTRQYGQGRVFYTSLGHREDIWDPNAADNKGERKNDPEIARQYQQHVLGGIRWALGLGE